MDLSQPGSANLSEEHFCLNLGLEPTTDGHLWSYTVPVRHSNEKSLILEFQCGTFQLVDFPEGYPNSISLVAAGVSGFADVNGNPTTTVFTLPISALTSGSNSPLNTFNICYRAAEPVIWNIGLLRQLSFDLIDDQGNQVQLPLSTPLNLQFKIYHTSL